ncbi:unnamed protein product [Allacma fusca]|uniref:Chitin-binding type-2 domain-containing protein n=1 Tax=Allacma fusca TaxID=39272 RepID=A0A8J2LJ16_9HEXA|nr:unnamed protein product [Allacma fusca]
MDPRLNLVSTPWWIHVVLISQVLIEVAGTVYSDDGKNFKCPLDPITERYPDPTDPTCRFYFLCHLGRAIPQVCDVRRAFHPTLKSCQPRISIPETLCEQAFNCNDNGYVEDPEDCTKYYMCFFHQSIPYSCIANYYFDPRKSACVKNKKKAKQCSKPKSMRQPDPKRAEFQRIRYQKPENAEVDMAEELALNPEPTKETTPIRTLPEIEDGSAE